MHKPDPLGTYPLVLRDNIEENNKPGELLFDDSENKIYYVNKRTKQKISLSKLIYDKIVSAKLENTEIHIAKEPNIISSIENLPRVEDRPFNSWYMVITKTD